MNLREQEDALFDEWENILPNIARDGVVDPDEYVSRDNRPRLLFIMKDANDPRAHLKNIIGGFLLNLAEQGLSAEPLLIRDRVQSAVPCRNLENDTRQSPLR